MLKYIWKKSGPNVRATIKFRDIPNTLSMAMCLFRDEKNPAFQG
jgi:hypothetical protein